MRRIFILIIGLAALPALAQSPPATTPVRIRGTIEKLDGSKLTVKSRDNHDMTITLADNFRILALVKKTVADIKDNDYIASTGLKGADGKLHCVELRIFPEALRGVAEGQFSWDSIPDSMMTNATVTGTAGAKESEVIKVKFKGTESEFVAGPECQVFAYVSGDAGLLKSGAAIFAVAQKKDDGTLTAASVTVEKDGVKPPM